MFTTNGFDLQPEEISKKIDEIVYDLQYPKPSKKSNMALPVLVYTSQLLDIHKGSWFTPRPQSNQY